MPANDLAHNKAALQWRHNGRDGVSNHQPHECLLKRLFMRRPKRTSKLRVTGLCAGNSLVTGEFPAQRASNAENVSIWWRHHGTVGMSWVDSVKHFFSEFKWVRNTLVCVSDTVEVSVQIPVKYTFIDIHVGSSMVRLSWHREIILSRMLTAVSWKTVGKTTTV